MVSSRSLYVYSSSHSNECFNVLDVCKKIDNQPEETPFKGWSRYTGHIISGSEFTKLRIAASFSGSNPFIIKQTILQKASQLLCKATKDLSLTSGTPEVITTPYTGSYTGVYLNLEYETGFPCAIDLTGMTIEFLDENDVVLETKGLSDITWKTGTAGFRTKIVGCNDYVEYDCIVNTVSFSLDGMVLNLDGVPSLGWNPTRVNISYAHNPSTHEFFLYDDNLGLAALRDDNNKLICFHIHMNIGCKGNFHDGKKYRIGSYGIDTMYQYRWGDENTPNGISDYRCYFYDHEFCALSDKLFHNQRFSSSNPNGMVTVDGSEYFNIKSSSRLHKLIKLG